MVHKYLAGHIFEVSELYMHFFTEYWYIFYIVHFVFCVCFLEYITCTCFLEILWTKPSMFPPCSPPAILHILWLNPNRPPVTDVTATLSPHSAATTAAANVTSSGCS